MAKKKMIDSWKSKIWYQVMAPNFFKGVEIALIPAQDDEHMMNRIIELPMKEITRDFSHMYTSVKLRVFEIKGKTAYTKFIGHSLSREYVRTLVRRRNDVVNAVFPVKTSDGLEFRLKLLVLTNGKVSEPKKKALYNILKTELTAKAKNTDSLTLIPEIVFGKTSAELFQKLKKIAAIKRVDVLKTQLKEEFDTAAEEKDEEAAKGDEELEAEEAQEEKEEKA